MKTRHLLTACLLSATALLSACNDNNSPLPTTTTISEFAKSLLALVTGGNCNTALPADINSVTLQDDVSTQDANSLPSGCNS